MMTLLGLKDDYGHDGRLLTADLTAIPTAVKKSHRFTALAQIYKQLNASFGQFAMDTLTASTRGLASNDAGDATYNSIESQIQSLTSQRDSLALTIRNALDNAEFNGVVISDQQANGWIAQAQSLLDQAAALAAGS